MTIDQAKAQSVWDFFRAISQIPRASGYEERICRWLVEFANDHGLSSRVDDAGNTVIELDASAGCEDATGLVMQSHVDMVCAKFAGVEHDFMGDGIKLVEKDGWMCADGTTLGADDGVGVAMAIALAAEEGLEHGPIELLFTVGEEVGLVGAQAMDGDFIRGRKLINLDSEDGAFTVGCAGGEQSDIVLPIQYEDVEDGWVCCKLSVSGLCGGHSGIDIHRGRANAIKVMTRVIDGLRSDCEIRLLSFEGGSAHNAIPINASAELFFKADQIKEVGSKIVMITENLQGEYSQTDAELCVDFEKLCDVSSNKAMTVESGEVAIRLLLAIPNGVDRFSEEFEGVVETSSNLAVVRTSADDSAMIVKSSKRSCKESGLARMRGMIETAADEVGAKVCRTSKYPAWEPDVESELLQTAVAIYERLHGHKAKVEVIHAGLECGVIGDKCDGMDMISIGPVIENPHSPQERVNIESVDDAWELLIELVKTLK